MSENEEEGSKTGIGSMTVRQLLIAARARIAQREHWTQGSYAQDADGEDCSIYAEDACRWCATGALMRELPLPTVASSDARRDVFWAARDVLSEIGGRPLTSMNDACGKHAEILDLFDRAIAAQPTQE